MKNCRLSKIAVLRHIYSADDDVDDIYAFNGIERIFNQNSRRSEKENNNTDISESMVFRFVSLVRTDGR